MKAGVRAEGANIRIRGRGIIDGLFITERRVAGNELRNCTDVTVEGIILKDAWGWTLPIRNCRNVLIDNMKIVSTRMHGNDGIDVVNSQNVLIKNCFLRTEDDCIAPKGQNLAWLAVEDVTVERCVLWADKAHIWRVGCESAAAGMRRMVFRDIDVLHYSPVSPAISVQPASDLLMEDVLFDNIRINGEGNPKFIEVITAYTQWAYLQIVAQRT